VYRREFPRIYELGDLVREPESATAYFRNLDKSLAEWPLKRGCYRELEAQLQGVDAEAWADLKAEVTPLLMARDPVRGWQSLFDILNHARAFNYLRKIGCTGIRFIPRSRNKGRRTPDLSGDLESAKVLCEVKTINSSKDEAERRLGGGVGTTTDVLSPEFFRKLDHDIVQAKEQMTTHDPDAARRIVYVVVNFDDLLHEYADRYGEQISQHIREQGVTGVEVIFDIKPAFSAAMS
jgi:hypothetical protein